MNAQRVTVVQPDTPVVVLYPAHMPEPRELQGAYCLPVLSSLSPLRQQLAGENANCSVDCDNSRGGLTRLWQHNAPLRAIARVDYGDGTQFQGVITNVTLGLNVSFTVES